MQEAVDALEQGIREGRNVLIWGDYDVDGITGATLILQTLRFHDVPSTVHLPDRRKEGYGLNIPEIERLAAEERPGILLTVDCGISDVKAVERARSWASWWWCPITTCRPRSCRPPTRSPTRASAKTTPVRIWRAWAWPSSSWPPSTASWKPCRASAWTCGRCWTSWHSARWRTWFRSRGQNRILVKNGLLKIAEAKRPGLAELKGASGFSPVAALGAGQVVFNLAPRINAAGRLGSPTLAHDMLLTPSHDEAAKLAQTLTSLNDERRSEEDRIYKEALEQAEANPKRLGFVLYGKDWHQGVIGIVASRIVEVYYRPVLILCSDGESLKGSGRSVPEFDLHAGLTRCADMLLGFGGHRQAAGLRIAPGRLDELRERFDAVIREELGEAPLTPSLKIDAKMPFSQASDFTVLEGARTAPALRHRQPRAHFRLAAPAGEKTQGVRPFPRTHLA